MSKKAITKIELIEKFLDPNLVESKSLKSVHRVLKLPISVFKFLTEEDEEIMKDLLKISSINDLSRLEYTNPFKKLARSKAKRTILSKIKKDDPEFEERIKKGITISLIINRISHQSISKMQKDQKIIVVGLDNAGKTAILSKFGGELGLKDLALLKPTRGVNRQEIKTGDFNLHIWDFGGQKDHRMEYLQEPETYFFGVDLILYVIDVQDPQRYDDSIIYFDKIIENLIRLEETPYILAFIHKYDPDIRENNEVLLNIELIKDLIKSILHNRNMNYEIHLSSIYSMISNEPEFSKFLKGVMKEQTSLTDPTLLKVAELGRIVESAINAVVQLSSTMMALEKRIECFEKPRRGRPPKNVNKDSLPSPEYSSVLPPPANPPPQVSSPGSKPSPSPGGFGARTAIISELKQMFVKKGITPKEFSK